MYSVSPDQTQPLPKKFLYVRKCTERRERKGDKRCERALNLCSGWSDFVLELGSGLSVRKDAVDGTILGGIY
jgi:hypothetical protein